MTPRAQPAGDAAVPALAVLISGTGTTLRNLIESRERGELIPRIELVISSNPAAAGLVYAGRAGIATAVVDWSDFRDPQPFSDTIFAACRAAHIDWVALGGFLKRLMIPRDFAGRVINIHPSLIPAFCGQGYYGLRVHQAVLAAGCRESGCTVHWVDDQYDHGPIIAQAKVPVLPTDTPATLAERVFRAECELYPRVINQLVG